MMKTNIYRVPPGNAITCVICHTIVCGVISFEIESLKSFGFICDDCLKKHNITASPITPDEKKPINVELPIS